MDLLTATDSVRILPQPAAEVEIRRERAYSRYLEEDGEANAAFVSEHPLQ